MRKILFIVLLLPALSAAQQPQPDYIIIGEYGISFALEKNDSIGLYSPRVEDFQVELKLEQTYTSLRELLRDNDFKRRNVYSTKRLNKINPLRSGDAFKFDGYYVNQDDEFYIEIQDDSHYYLLNWYFDDYLYNVGEDILRYHHWKFDSFDVLVFYFSSRNGVFANYLIDLEGKGLRIDFHKSKRPVEKVSRVSLQDEIVKRDEFGKIQGFDTIVKAGKQGVADRLKGTEILPAVYDSIGFHKWIHVWKEDRFGIFDYQGKQVLPIAYKDYYYSWNDEIPLMYLDFENNLYAMDLDRKEKFLAGPKEEPDLSAYFPGRVRSYYELGDIKGDSLVVYISSDVNPALRYPADTLYGVGKYKDVFFDSGKKDSQIAHGLNFFALKPSGKLDVFRIKMFEHIFREETDIEDFKIVRNFYNHFRPFDEAKDLILRKGGLYKLPHGYHYKDDFRYQKVFYGFGHFFRVQFSDGSLGWGTDMGKQYPDPD